VPVVNCRNTGDFPRGVIEQFFGDFLANAELRHLRCEGAAKVVERPWFEVRPEFFVEGELAFHPAIEGSDGGGKLKDCWCDGKLMFFAILGDGGREDDSVGDDPSGFNLGNFASALARENEQTDDGAKSTSISSGFPDCTQLVVRENAIAGCVFGKLDALDRVHFDVVTAKAKLEKGARDGDGVRTLARSFDEVVGDFSYLLMGYAGKLSIAEDGKEMDIEHPQIIFLRPRLLLGAVDAFEVVVGLAEQDRTVRRRPG
jgi:hypothetical protein